MAALWGVSINSSQVFTTSLPGRAAMDVNFEVFVAKARTLHNASHAKPECALTPVAMP
jgi:hypothetical protein